MAIVAEKVNNLGFTPEEQAELDSGPGEGAESIEPEAEEPEAEAEADPEPEAEAEVAPAAQKAAPTKPPPGFVPQQAMHEARQQAREAKERADRYEQMFQKLIAGGQPNGEAKSGQPEVQIPDYDQDPLGHTKAQLDLAMRQIQQLTGTQQERAQNEQRQAQTHHVLSQYAESVKNYSKTATDFNKAYDFAVQARDAELQALGVDDPGERNYRIQYEEGQAIAYAMSKGRDPAEAVYNYAKAKGWKTAADENKLARLQQGQQHAKSLTPSKVAGDDELTLQKLADLDGDEFDQAWEKARKLGRLG